MLSRLSILKKHLPSTTNHLIKRTMTSLPSTMKACQIQEQGDISVIQMKDVPIPVPGPGQVLFKASWAGVNFIDTYQRGGVYKLPMPYILGNESSGEIVALGPDFDEKVYGFGIGDKVVGYTAGGSFAEYVLTAAKKTVKIPEGVTSKEACTVLLQGLTALSNVKEAHEVKAGQFILVQACAGGLGLLLVQLCKYYGAHVIGTCSTPEKAALGLAAGCSEVIIYAGKTKEEVAAEIFAITGGEGIDRGVHAVFDGVGADTFEMDFDVVRRKGTIVSLGNASGAVPPFAPLKLGPKNLKICRTVLNQYVHTHEEFVYYTTELFKIVGEGHLKLAVHGDYPLTTDGIKQSQIDITSRKTSGKLLIKID